LKDLIGSFLHFTLDLLGKLGPPTFAARVVACFLSSHFELIHLVFMGVGLLFTGVDYLAGRVDLS